MRRLTAFLTALALASLLAAAPAAQAGWFGADVVDGPADIVALGDVDLARDGSGGLVYLKRDAGVPQAYLSRLSRGAWRRPEKLSAGAPVTEAVVTATDGGRLAVAWVAGGEVWGTVITSARRAPAPPVVLGRGGASGVSVDMGVNEDGYAVWSAGGDVRAARLDGTAWTPLDGALDLDATRPAGQDRGRPRVAVSAEGNAVATWAEVDATGRSRVASRRLTRLALSSFPQDLTLESFGGERAGGADSPDIDIEDDGSFAWVAFRQDIGGRSRTVARRLRGSLFEDPFAIDAGVTSSSPRIDFAGKGIGGAVAAADGNAVYSAYLSKFDAFDPATRMDATPGDAAPAPVVATSERGDVYVAWRSGAGGGDVRARRKEGEKPFEREFVGSNPAYGAVAPGQLAVGSDRLGNTTVAMLQGAGPGSRITAAAWDRPPGRPGLVSVRARDRGRKLLVRWTPGAEIWGRQTFTVRLDGKVVGSTGSRRILLRRKLAAGRHRLTVTTSDRRRQTATSSTESFRVRRSGGRVTILR